MPAAGNDSLDHIGTADETLTHDVYPEVIFNKDFIQVCGRCGVVFNDLVSFLLHLTKRYDSIRQKESWSCPIILDVKQGIYAQKTIEYL